MNILPIDLQKIILDYKEQLDISEKKRRVINQLKKRYRVNYGNITDDNGKVLEIITDVEFYGKKYFYRNFECAHGYKGTIITELIEDIIIIEDDNLVQAGCYVYRTSMMDFNHETNKYEYEFMFDDFHCNNELCYDSECEGCDIIDYRTCDCDVCRGFESSSEEEPEIDDDIEIPE